MTRTQLKHTFNNALKLAVAQGRTPSKFVYVRDNCCCAVGAVVLAKAMSEDPGNDHEANIAEVLMVAVIDIISIEAGFCGWSSFDRDPDLFAYGQLLAKRYLK